MTVKKVRGVSWSGEKQGDWADEGDLTPDLTMPLPGHVPLTDFLPWLWFP